MEIFHFKRLDNRKTFLLLLFYVSATQGGLPPPSSDVADISSNARNGCVMPSDVANTRYTLLGGAVVKPGEEVEEESVLKLECLSGTIPTGSSKIYCKEKKWSSFIPTCTYCGQLPAKRESDIILGEDTLVNTDFPWHVAIYSQYDQQESTGLTPRYWCGGSIINGNTIISAAHCFYDPINEKPYDSRLFTVAAGKMYSDFNHIEQTKKAYIQKSMVKDIKIPESYTGESNSYQGDLALLILQTPLKFSNFVLPICLNLHDKDFDDDQSSPGTLSKVAGFGVPNADSFSPSEVLKAISVPIVGRTECRLHSPPEFEKYILFDKTCAGFLNGTGVCRGDGGGGLVVRATVNKVETWFLRGIVSTSPASEGDKSCSTGTYFLATRPFQYKDFIENVLK